MRKLFAIIFILSLAIFPWLVLSPATSIMKDIPVRLVLFCLIAAGGSLLCKLAWPRYSWGIAAILATLCYATAYKLASYLPDISAYPFSLAWSEASRYYYASLWLSRQVYGVTIPPSVLHPSRYLLQAIPFLLSNSSIWLSRFWQVVLWVAGAGVTSWLLARRLGLTGRNKPVLIALGMILWGFLFLFQGPVYYHLLFMVILVLLGYNSQHPWRTLFVVLVASLWAGISRVNWLPVPGMLAAALYFIEVKKGSEPLPRYLFPPILWSVAGSVSGLASQLAYQRWSGNPEAWFGSSFTSDLLWYRLFPNPTFRLGVLPSAILVSLPIIGLMGLKLLGHLRQYHPIRLLGLTAILGVLFAGGIVVSVKIGGGSNLHNLDAYLSLLLVIGSAVYFERVVPDQALQPGGNYSGKEAISTKRLLKIGESLSIAAALAIPVYFILIAGGQLPQHDYAAAQAALSTINAATQEASSQGGEVLFISQRQLLTFNYVKDVKLVPEDELVFLMEMAMGGNAAYMDAFQADISSQRFAMIVSEPLVIQWQGRNHSFGEENDAWVRGVSEPVLCYYRPSITLDSVGLVLYTPRANPCK